MMVVGFWTAGTPYEAEAVELVKTLKAFGLAYDVREYPHPGSWVKATLLLPQVVQDARARYPGQTLLYLDADARVRQPLSEASGWTRGGVPALRHFEKSTDDVGFYFLPNGRSIDATHEELCTGTMLWKDTIAANTVLTAWVEACRTVDAEGRRGQDQEILQRLLPSQSYIKVWRLPHEWCWMDIISDRLGKLDPIIYHTQASRRFRKAVSA